MENESHQIAWLSGAERPPTAAKTGVVHPTQMTNGHSNNKASADRSCEGDEVNDVGKLLSATRSSPNNSQNQIISLQQQQQQTILARNFATEHRIFLRAILDLLSQRDDNHAIQADINNPNNIIKIGPLRKASHRIKGLWKIKYVELRRGTFSYFDNNSSSKQQKQKRTSNNNMSTASAAASSTTANAINNNGHHHNLLRKDIPLHASSCTCRAVKIRSVKILPNTLGSGGGAVFELRTHGGSKRLWMANTIEERSSWIQAIHNAMLGSSVTSGDNYLEYQADILQHNNNDDTDYDGRGQQKNKNNSRKKKKKKDKLNNKINNVPLNSPYREYIEFYLKVREATFNATSKNEYLDAISNLRGKSITVPVQWIKSQLLDTNNTSSNNATTTTTTTSFVENDISSCVEQLWKDLLRDSVMINDQVLMGDSFHGPERIVGQLTQEILASNAGATLPFQDDEQGNASSNTTNHVQQQRIHTNGNKQQQHESTRISEAQAILYARDILLASGRTRSGGDSYFCAENLCLNRNLIVLCPSSCEASPLSIQVSEKQQQGTKEDGLFDLSGWAYARSSSSSGSNNSKPWRRQYLMLSSHGVLSCYGESNPKPHQLIEQVILKGAKVEQQYNCSSQTNFAKQKQQSKYTNATKIPPNSDKSSVKEGGNIVYIATKDGGVVREYLFDDEFDFLYWFDSFKKASSSTACCAVQEDGKCHAPSTGNGHSNASSSLLSLANVHSKNKASKVDVVVNVCTNYKMCTMDPAGIESEDTWA